MYTEHQRRAIVDYVCDQLANKRPLYKVLAEDKGMPDRSTFHMWTLENEDYSNKVARARELGMEAHLEDMIEISDNANADAYTDGEGNVKIDGEAIQRSKVRIYAREKAAQMLAPRRFGQKVDVTSGGEKLPAPVPQNVLIDARIQSLIGIAIEKLNDPIEAEKRRLLDDE